MAYGKNPAALGLVASFRQMSGEATRNGGGKRVKGNIPYFVDMYQPSLGEIDTVRLIPGNYLQDQLVGEGDAVQSIAVERPFIKFVEHFHGGKQRGCICSAGAFANFKDKRGACHGCDIFWETVIRTPEGKLQSPIISRQNKYAFSVFDYGVYHKMEQIDRQTGQVRTSSVTKEAYFNWTKCLGQGCDACRAGKESKTGDMRHWPMNYTQFQVLRDTEIHIGKSCATCSTENSIVSLGWMCQHCGECAIDMGSTALKNDELLQITDNRYLCASCGESGFLTEVYECHSCAPRGQTGVRASLFDVDLRVKLIVAGGNNNKSLQVMGWSAPHPINPALAEVAKPVDLVARYAPDFLESQASKFGITTGGPQRSPVTSTSQPAAATAYSNPYGPKTA
jgi:hypothetical protein